MDDSKVAVLLEDLKAQFQVFGEGLQTVIQKTDHLEQRFDGMEKRFDGVEQRLDRLEQKVSQHDERFDRLEKRLDRHDQRFDQLEKRLDQHDQRFDQLEKRQNDQFEQNRMEHRQMIQMIRELNHDVQIRLKRVK